MNWKLPLSLFFIAIHSPFLKSMHQLMEDAVKNWGKKNESTKKELTLIDCIKNHDSNNFELKLKGLPLSNDEINILNCTLATELEALDHKKQSYKMVNRCGIIISTAGAGNLFYNLLLQPHDNPNQWTLIKEDLACILFGFSCIFASRPLSSNSAQKQQKLIKIQNLLENQVKK